MQDGIRGFGYRGRERKERRNGKRKGSMPDDEIVSGMCIVEGMSKARADLLFPWRRLGHLATQ